MLDELFNLFHEDQVRRAAFIINFVYDDQPRRIKSWTDYWSRTLENVNTEASV